MSRIAHLSPDTTDSMTLLEERDFINLLVEDLEREQQEIEKARGNK